MDIVCTVCSRLKLTDVGDLPARMRYIGSHIDKVAYIAEHEEGLPLFFLSGHFGLIPADTPISYCDENLVNDEVPFFLPKIDVRLDVYGIRKIIFYTKDKEPWIWYESALRISCARRNVEFEVRYLADDD